MTQPPTIRTLTLDADLAAVADLKSRAADYIRLETGTDPTPAMALEFFTDAPPGGDPTQSLKLGLFVGPRLQAIADVAFGWPEASDAFIGLMLVASDARRQGYGPLMLHHIERAARARAAPRLLLAVLDENPDGRRFWEREGFSHSLTLPAARMGDTWHIRHRLQKRL